MKIIALTAAGLFAASALTPLPAEAQRGGWHDRGYDRPHYDRRAERRWDRRGHRGYRAHRAYRPYRAAGYGRGYRRGRVVCRWTRGYYGPVQRCVRIIR